MSEGLAFGGLLTVSLTAVATPLVARALSRVKIPSVVLEIVARIVVGPSVLGWVEVDQPIDVLALLDDRRGRHCNECGRCGCTKPMDSPLCRNAHCSARYGPAPASAAPAKQTD